MIKLLNGEYMPNWEGVVEQLLKTHFPGRLIGEYGMSKSIGEFNFFKIARCDEILVEMIMEIIKVQIECLVSISKVRFVLSYVLITMETGLNCLST